MIVLLAIMSGIILYMLLNQRGFQRLDHVRLNREDEFREHTERRLAGLEQSMRRAADSDPDLAAALAAQLREQQQRSQQVLERTSSLMQSQLAALSQRITRLEESPLDDRSRIIADGLVETRDRLQELELEMAAQQVVKHRLLGRVEMLERGLGSVDAEDCQSGPEVQTAAEATSAAGHSPFFLSNEKYEQIAEMMIRNADFADICRDLKVSRSEIELVEAMGIRRSA